MGSAVRIQNSEFRTQNLVGLQEAPDPRHCRPPASVHFSAANHPARISTPGAGGRCARCSGDHISGAAVQHAVLGVLGT